MIKVIKRKANHSSQLFCFELKWRHVQFVFSAYLLLFLIVVLQQEYHNYSAFLLCNYLFLVWLSFPCFTLDVELVLVTGFFMFILWSPLTQIYPATGSSALSNRIFFFEMHRGDLLCLHFCILFLLLHIVCGSLTHLCCYGRSLKWNKEVPYPVA